MPPTPPTVVNLVVAEGIHSDFAGKASLLGVFHAYHARHYPTTIPHAGVFLAVTDGRGEVELTVRLVAADDEDAEPLVSHNVVVRFSGPLVVSQFSVEFTAIPLPKPGSYWWQVVCGGAVIADQRLLAVQVG